MLHNTDLESFHKRINSHINLVGVVSGNKLLPNIIRMCRLKPASIFERSKFNFGTHLINHWVDEFGFMLTVDGNDTKIDYDCDAAHISTDLFFGRSLYRTVSNSTFIFVGQVGNEHIILCYGVDEYVRAFKFCDGRRYKISPLSIGIGALCILSEHTNIGIAKELGRAASHQFDRIAMFPWPTKQDISSCLPSHILKEINGEG
jgi:hypothetical protein